MEKVSVIIPSRNEKYLNHTVKDLLKKAEEDIEIIVILDGAPAIEPLPQDPRIKVIYREISQGMRDAINTGAEAATGKYLMKCDAHCCFDQGFDVKLKKDCEPDWTVVPRRYDIDKDKWDRHPNRNFFYDFQYIGHPDDEKYSFKGVDWPEYGARVKGEKIVDLMTSQGSCWFMFRDRFFELGGLDDGNYGTMGAEAQEVCLKSWLSGGRYVLNRNTWYAHKKKRTSVKMRGYRKPVGQWRKSRAYAKECWLNNKWPGQTRKLSWLIEKFKPIPGWHTSLEKVKANRYIREKFRLNRACEDYPRTIDGLNREGLVNLWKELGYKVGCEVGVETGVFSHLMFKRIPGLKMYLVDPWFDYKGAKRRGKRHESAEELAHRYMKGKDATFIKDISENAYREIPDDSLDFVYIDGNHDFDYVMLDILLWQRKVRKGGMVAGHDYVTDKKPYTRHVKKAVDAYMDVHNIVPVYLTDFTNQETKADRHASWFWIKG